MTCERRLGMKVWPIAESGARLLPASRTSTFSNVILQVTANPISGLQVSEPIKSPES